MKMSYCAWRKERESCSWPFLFLSVNFLFSSFGQEVEGDVVGCVHPDCLVYPSQPFSVQRLNQ